MAPVSLTHPASWSSFHRRAIWILMILVLLVAGIIGFMLWLVSSQQAGMTQETTPMVDGFRTDRDDPYYYFPLTKTVPSTAIVLPHEIVDMHFIIGEGGGENGYDTMRIVDNGDVEFLVDLRTLRQEDPRPQIIRYKLAPKMVGDLKKLLLDVNFFSLPAEYHSDAFDGGQWYVKVGCTGGKRGVYCDNHFPDEIRRISDFIRERVMPDVMRSKDRRAVSNWESEWKRVNEGDDVCN